MYISLCIYHFKLGYICIYHYVYIILNLAIYVYIILNLAIYVYFILNLAIYVYIITVKFRSIDQGVSTFIRHITFEPPVIEQR